MYENVMSCADKMRLCCRAPRRKRWQRLRPGRAALLLTHNAAEPPGMIMPPDTTTLRRIQRVQTFAELFMTLRGYRQTLNGPPSPQILRGSSSAISKPTFASK